MRLILVLAVVALATGVGLYFALRGRPTTPEVVVPPATAPTTTKPATAPAEPKPADKPPPPPMSYVDVVRANIPGYPATQPLDQPLDTLTEAAHVLVRGPVYLDGRLNLWLTRPDAGPLSAVAGKPQSGGEFVVDEPVVFVHWTANDRGYLAPNVVTPRPDGGFDYVTSAEDRKVIRPTHAFRWDRAKSWYDRIIVPSATGVSVFRFTPEPVESYQDLLDPRGGGGGPTTAPAAGPATLPTTAPATRPATGPTTSPVGAGPQPQVLYDGNGFLAWLPWEHGRPGGRGVARFVPDWEGKDPNGGQWVVLDDAAGWPDRILHLVPLIGGNVVQLIAGDGDIVKVGISTTHAEVVKREEIEALVVKLASASRKDRDEAYAKLTRYGPAVRPILKELLDLLPPEAQSRARELMTEQVQPLLGPMRLNGDKLQLVGRHKDGGAVFYAEAGVQITGPDGDPVTQAPAWLAVRPGRAVYLLPENLVDDLAPGKGQLIAVEGHDDDWVVVSDVRGPRRYIGNALKTMLRKDEAAFTDLYGVDRRGRWLFRRPGRDDQTLVLDPTLPDLVPRLPVWNYTTADEVGWDKDNWPAVKQFGQANRLLRDHWEALATPEELLTRPDQIPPATQPTTQPTTPAPSTLPAAPMTAPATVPATGPATAPATGPAFGAGTRPATGPATHPMADGHADDLGTPLLVGPDGSRYYGGITDLRVVSPSGREVVWSLPDIASGQDPVRLVRTDDGRLFLFNQPGRVLRLNPTPEKSAPFELEATFTRGVPSADDVARVWVDPAGRIIMAHGKQLTILFPAGYIPSAIRQMIRNPEDEPEDGP